MVYEWIRNLAFYVILSTMLLSLLPDKKYEKYLKLFMGMVFFLLVISPLASWTGTEDQVVEAFARITFENDVEMLRKELEDVEERRAEILIEYYEEMAEETIAGVSAVEKRIGEHYGVEERNIALGLDAE